MKKVRIMFHFMLFAFTQEWDGTKYQYYRYIPSFLGRIGKGEGVDNLATSQVLPGKELQKQNFCSGKNLILILRHKYFHGGKILLKEANKNAGGRGGELSSHGPPLITPLVYFEMLFDFYGKFCPGSRGYIKAL